MLPPPRLNLSLFLSSQTLPSDFHRTDSFLLLCRSLCHLLWEASHDLWIPVHTLLLAKSPALIKPFYFFKMRMTNWHSLVERYVTMSPVCSPPSTKLSRRNLSDLSTMSLSASGKVGIDEWMNERGNEWMKLKQHKQCLQAVIYHFMGYHYPRYWTNGRNLRQCLPCLHCISSSGGSHLEVNTILPSMKAVKHQWVGPKILLFVETLYTW